jgi:hypothetical protein
MNNNDPHKKRKKAFRKRKKIMRKGISLLWSLSFVSLSLDRTRSREEERERAHSLESAIERENTLAQANERARECASNRGLCADRVLRVLDMNFGV